jgi:predicted transport protein
MLRGLGFKKGASTSEVNDGKSESSYSSMLSFSTPNLGIMQSISNSRNKNNSQESPMKIVESELKKVMALLEEIRLQCPQSHLGLVLAFASTTLTPLSGSGMKFTFYRMGLSNEAFVQVDQSFRSYYAPTYDDISAKICCKVEDSMDQGFSRFLESGYIEADSVLTRLVEDSVKQNYYEIKDAGVSFGVSIADLNEIVTDSGSADGSVNSRPSCLTRSLPFLQLEGRSYVEVDADGIFLSLPLPAASSNKKVRRGLHISSLDVVDVECVQLASLVLTLTASRRCVSTDMSNIPMTLSSFSTDSNDSSASFSIDSPAPSPNTSLKQRVRGVSTDVDIVIGNNRSDICPWKFIRIANFVDNPDADIEGTNEDEEEATSFQTITSSLEKFIQSLVGAHSEVKICVSCADRIQRDALCGIIRTLCIPRSTITHEDRLKLLPWRSASTGERIALSQAGHVEQTTDAESAKKIQLLEEKIASLTASESSRAHDSQENVLQLTRKISQLEKDVAAAATREQEVNAETGNKLKSVEAALEEAKRALVQSEEASQQKDLHSASSKEMLNANDSMREELAALRAENLKLHDNAKSLQENSNKVAQQVAESAASVKALTSEVGLLRAETEAKETKFMSLQQEYSAFKASHSGSELVIQDEIQKLRTELTSKQTEYVALQQEYGAFKADRNAADATGQEEVEKLRTELASKDTAYETLQQDFSSFKADRSAADATGQDEIQKVRAELASKQSEYVALQQEYGAFKADRNAADATGQEEVEKLRNDLASKDTAYETLQQDFSSFKADRSAADATGQEEVGKLRNDLARKDTVYAALQQEYGAFKADRNAADSAGQEEIQNLRTDLAGKDTAYAALQQEYNTFKADRSAADSAGQVEVDKLRTELDSKDSAYAALQQEFSSFKADRNAAESAGQEEVEKLRSELANKDTAYSSLQQEFSAFKADRSAADSAGQEEVENLRSELSNRQNEYAALQQEYSAFKADRSAVDAAGKEGMQKLRAELASKDTAFAALQQDFSAAEAVGKQEIRMLRSELAGKDSDYTALQQEYTAFKADRNAAESAGQEEVEILRSELAGKDTAHAALQEEFDKYKSDYTVSASAVQSEYVLENDRLKGEVNHLQKKVDSLAKDLKKVMRDETSKIAEYERMLVSKSEQCHILETRVLMLEETLREEQEYIRTEKAETTEKRNLSSKFKGLFKSSDKD